jgi:hypothetical protein
MYRIGATHCCVSLVLASLGCGGDCDSVDDCDADECTVVTGRKLDATSGMSVPAGCVPGTSLDSGSAITHARAPDGTCWEFPSTLIPRDFEETDECSPY